MPAPSTAPCSLRIALILVGVALLIWLTFENHSELLVLIFAAICSVLFTLKLILWVGLDRFSVYAWVIGGGLSGLAVPLLAALFMFLKNGLHSHIAPDFTLAQVVSVLQRAPFFVIGGSLLGLGIGLLRDFRKDSP
jgi:hypothetical protein